MLELQIILLAILLLFSGIFSGVETALMSLSRVKVEALVKQKIRGSEVLQKIKENPHRLIITILIGNNLVNIGAASFATVVFMDIFGSSGAGIATGIMTFLILVFGEITPKTFAAQNRIRISLLAARPINILTNLLAPVVLLLESVSRFMLKLTGVKEQSHLSEEELKTIVTIGKEEGVLSEEAAEMMQNLLEFEGTTVMEVMTPKVDVQMVDGNLKLRNVMDFVVKNQFSRHPIFLNNEDNIIGILDVDDVLKYAKNKKLDVRVKMLVRKVNFVPETKEIDDLLVEFEGKKIPMAIVVDEYGEVSGIITVEDILEEIVGDIFDKSRKYHRYMTKVNENTMKVDARMSVEQLSKAYNIEIKSKKFNTISGFLQYKLGRIPKKGEKIRVKGLTIIVDDVTNKGVNIVRIIKAQNSR